MHDKERAGARVAGIRYVTRRSGNAVRLEFKDF